MKNKAASIAFTGIVLTAISLSAMPKPSLVDSCASLATDAVLKSMAGAAITSATVVSGTFTPAGNTQDADGNPVPGRAIQGLPSFCRVTATLKPSPVSDIKVEVWLPSGSWNQKLQGVGNGGLGGTISYGALALGVKNGYATVSTDDGHEASDTSWLASEEKELDSGSRAIHEMTVAAKEIVQHFYGQSAKHNYFNGCSYGGSQGLGEAQLHPEDYDAILAGDPGNFLTHTRAVAVWNFQTSHKENDSPLSDQTLRVVTKAVLKECGGQYGSTDGFLNDPRSCSFDPEKLVCKAGEDPSTCITGAQAVAVKKIYEGPVRAESNKQFWPGLVRGSEQPEGMNSVGWQSQAITHPAPDSRAMLFYSMGVFQDPTFDYHTASFENLADAGDKRFPYIDHPITDIQSFIQRGGKLLIYHGWADPAITPLNSINYYGAVVETAAAKQKLNILAELKEIQKSARLFMVPGMGHCTGGPGASSFDALSALDQWVEHGTAPDKIVAAHVVKGADAFTRPLCPYPQAAAYSGSGDRNDASNWVCKTGPFTYDSSFYNGAPIQK